MKVCDIIDAVSPRMQQDVTIITSFLKKRGFIDDNDEPKYFLCTVPNHRLDYESVLIGGIHLTVNKGITFNNISKFKANLVATQPLLDQYIHLLVDSYSYKFSDISDQYCTYSINLYTDADDSSYNIDFLTRFKCNINLVSNIGLILRHLYYKCLKGHIRQDYYETLLPYLDYLNLNVLFSDKDIDIITNTKGVEFYAECDIPYVPTFSSSNSCSDVEHFNYSDNFLMSQEEVALVKNVSNILDKVKADNASDIKLSYPSSINEHADRYRFAVYTRYLNQQYIPLAGNLSDDESIFLDKIKAAIVTMNVNPKDLTLSHILCALNIEKEEEFLLSLNISQTKFLWQLTGDTKFKLRSYTSPMWSKSELRRKGLYLDGAYNLCSNCNVVLTDVCLGPDFKIRVCSPICKQRLSNKVLNFK